MPADDPLDVRIGENLRQIRIARLVSLEELGRKIGVSYQQVQKYELGVNRISVGTLLRIADALQCDVIRFFGGLPDQKLSDEDAVLVDPDDLNAARALARIEDQAVQALLRELIVLLGRTSR